HLHAFEMLPDKPTHPGPNLCPVSLEGTLHSYVVKKRFCKLWNVSHEHTLHRPLEVRDRVHGTHRGHSHPVQSQQCLDCGKILTLRRQWELVVTGVQVAQCVDQTTGKLFSEPVHFRRHVQVSDHDPIRQLEVLNEPKLTVLLFDAEPPI